MQDYSQQLSEIAKALARPTLSPWVIALFSAMLGMVTGLLAQPIHYFLVDSYRRRVMRRIVYIELANMFLTIDRDLRVVILSPSEQKGSILADLCFDGERYCKNNIDVYLQLKEHTQLSYLYRMFHNIEEKTDSLGAARWAMLQFAHFADSNKKYNHRYRRYFDRDSESLLERISERSRECEQLNEATMREWSERIDDFKRKAEPSKTGS
jgi:hypothetical protein